MRTRKKEKLFIRTFWVVVVITIFAIMIGASCKADAEHKAFIQQTNAFIRKYEGGR